MAVFLELGRKKLLQVAVANPDVEEKVTDLVLASVAGQQALVQQAFGGGSDGTGRGQGVFADESGRGDGRIGHIHNALEWKNHILSFDDKIEWLTVVECVSSRSI